MLIAGTAERPVFKILIIVLTFAVALLTAVALETNSALINVLNSAILPSVAGFWLCPISPFK